MALLADREQDPTGKTSWASSNSCMGSARRSHKVVMESLGFERPVRQAEDSDQNYAISCALANVNSYYPTYVCHPLDLVICAEKR